jgi:hypothetical protein
VISYKPLTAERQRNAGSGIRHWIDRHWRSGNNQRGKSEAISARIAPAGFQLLPVAGNNHFS